MPPPSLSAISSRLNKLIKMDRTLSSLLRTVATPTPVTLKKPKKIIIPKRIPSIEEPEKEIVYITADKTTCAECKCYPYESPYTKHPKLKPCLHSPPTLYELAEAVLHAVWPPDCFMWDEDDVVQWMNVVVELPQYANCIRENRINGRRLIMLENPSNLPKINIHKFEHIQLIVKKVHELYSTEVERFHRSIGLPRRLPFTFCRWFHSRTGPPWGIRKTWKRTDVLRWMKILGPKPLHLDHWDLVWYQKPEFPKTMFARVPEHRLKSKSALWRHDAEEFCNEYQAPRKFKVVPSAEEELIWMEHPPSSPSWQKPVQYVQDMKAAKKKPQQVHSRFMKPPLELDGLAGKDLILARRIMPTPKFLPKYFDYDK